MLICDRDWKWSREVRRELDHAGVHVALTPFQAPNANAFCERLIGTIRRECLDFVILFNERHLRTVLGQWVAHYNRGRPHASLGPGLPDPPSNHEASLVSGHWIRNGHYVLSEPVVGGLHHEYRLVALAT